MVNPAGFSQKTLVGDIAQQFMFERILDGLSESGRFTPEDQFLSAKRGERAENFLACQGRFDRRALFARTTQTFHCIVPKGAAHYRSPLKNQALDRLQAVQARLQYSHQGGRHAGRRQALRFDAPLLRTRQNHFLIDEHLDNLLDVKRDSFGATDNKFAQRLRNLRRAPQKRFDQHKTLLSCQRLQFQPLAVAEFFTPARPALKQSGPRQTDDEQWHAPAGRRQMHQQVQRSIVTPMDIFRIENGSCNRQFGRLWNRTAGRSFEKVGEALKGAVANLAGVIEDLAQPGTRGKIQPEQLTDEMSVEKIIFSCEQFDNSLLQLLTRYGRRIAVLNFEAVGEHIAHERKRQPCSLAIGSAIKNADAIRTKLKPLLELAQQARLADARLTGDGDDLRILFVDDGLQSRLEEFEFLFSPHHLRLHSFDSTQNSTELHSQSPRFGPQHDVRLNRLRPALHFEWRQCLHIEKAMNVAVSIV